MAVKRVTVRSAAGGVPAQEVLEGAAAIQAELGIEPAFPDEVQQAAEAAAAAPRLPDLDRTDLPLVTLDPEGAMDLDQAVHLERSSSGFVVHYAIADVAAFVSPGDAVDEEAHRRGETLYGAGAKVPLHPPVISEDAGSLLPDQERPALLWTITLDEEGEGTEVRVERARVRSRARYTYEEAQRLIDSGEAEPTLALLAEIGPLREAREAARGGVSLPLPEQQVDATGGHWRLEFRTLLPVEGWNAQISLLTGMAAASLMVYARVGLLRTLPPADPRDVARLRHTAEALGIDWPTSLGYPQFVRTLDPATPRHVAMMVACTRLFRGAGYVGFDGELPELAEHSAVAAEYAHVTAPLRRLVDRYASEICVALCAGEEVPEWVLARLPGLPGTMAESGRRAGQYESAVLNLVESKVLQDRVGESFEGVVVSVEEKDPRRGTVTLVDPAIEARVQGSRDLPLGERVTVTLTEADPAARRVQFTL